MTTTARSLTELYAEVQQFHAAQMQALDSGDFDAYSATFTEDGEFAHTPGRPAARTRSGIAQELHAYHQERFAQDPVQRRHSFSMLRLSPRTDGAIDATFYCLVITSRPGVRQPEIAPSCAVHDVLVREKGQLLTRSRRVAHDYLSLL
ncbi:nuclear transport factor 2 family protein [Streptomyces sp. GMR22]|uniref:nuclear transport factor 2 family protein n=1 Tax=Streptomyces sp. GMR22 TaxID=2759524 RepID=UPI0015F86B2E|nr:nuclear transport factor 2 family protein [Streptomyces sp. GMR22]MBA6437023.1 nuclear transport factor 2 family protein [Streptomyces sp. GMR22]